jgi:hypothetical protein
MKRPKITGERCPLVQCRARLEFIIGEFGRTVARCRQCERRLAGICRDCSAPVEGTIGKAYRCAEHKRLKREADSRANTERNREERNARQRERSKAPARKKRKAETRRAWAKRNPEKVKAQKRRYHLKRTPGYVAGYQRSNADPVRLEKKRAQARERYYVLHPERPAPVCRVCAQPIPFTGLGRPRVTCGSRGACLNAPHAAGAAGRAGQSAAGAQ